MIKINGSNQLGLLRRLALTSQGLLASSPFGSGLVGARNAISHLGYVQIDTISVVERAHHHILYSRVPKYLPDMLNQLLVNRDIFEYWTHAAAFIPIDDFRFSLPYKHAIKSGEINWYRTRDKKLMAELLARIRTEGQLRTRDVGTASSKLAGWWDWKPAKNALEQLYMQGDLMISNRQGFQKAYDLTERVLPAHIDTSMPSVEDFAQHIVEQQLRCHGLVSLKGLTYLRRNSALRKAVKDLVNDKLLAGELEQIQVNSGEVFLLVAGSLEGSSARLSNRMMILSPFDNSVIQRDRLKSLFQYNYQLECYVPAAKRQHGYFSLPLLYRDEFIGRMNCKAHRKDYHLEIKSLYIEQDNFDKDAVINAFVEAIIKFRDFQKCNTVSLVEVYPSKMGNHFCNALKYLT